MAPRRPCLPDAPPGALLIAHSYEGTHGADFAETITVSCTGRVDHAAPRPVSGNEAGAYRLQLAPAELEPLTRLADQLVTEVAPAPSLPPQGADASVTVYSDPPVTRAIRQTAAQASAAAWFSAMRERLRTSPLAALVLEVPANQHPTAAAPMIAVQLTQRGTEPVEVTLEADEIVVRLWDAAGAVSQVSARPAIGLMDARGRLLDGLSSPATLARRARGTLALPVPLQHGRVEVQVVLRGRMSWPSDLPAPGSGMDRPGTATFAVTSDVVPIEFPP